MPKRGFTNAQFRTEYHVVNLKSLEDRFAEGDSVTAESLAKVGLIRDTKKPVKVLGEGDLTKKLDVTATKLSKSAEAKIKAAGGSVTLVEKKKWTRAAGKPAKPAAEAKPEAEKSSSEE
jgi:large subunit ribosomal protein L15